MPVRVKHAHRGPDFAGLDLLGRREGLLFHDAFDLTALAIDGVEFAGQFKRLRVVIGG